MSYMECPLRFAQERRLCLRTPWLRSTRRQAVLAPPRAAMASRNMLSVSRVKSSSVIAVKERMASYLGNSQI